MSNDQIIKNIDKFLSLDNMSTLIDNGELKEVFELTTQVPYIDHPTLLELIKLFIQEGYKLTDLFDKPDLSNCNFNTTPVKFELNERDSVASIKYATPSIRSNTFNLFMILMTGLDYKFAKPYLWVYAPTNIDPYAEIKVYCDTQAMGKQVLIDDVTDIVYSNYMLSTEIATDHDFGGDKQITIYNLKGKEAQANSLIKNSLLAYIEKNWYDIFEHNKYEELGIII